MKDGPSSLAAARVAVVETVEPLNVAVMVTSVSFAGRANVTEPFSSVTPLAPA